MAHIILITLHSSQVCGVSKDLVDALNNDQNDISHYCTIVRVILHEIRVHISLSFH
jgi:hypothetical protein